jgi:hypothetical protein
MISPSRQPRKQRAPKTTVLLILAKPRRNAAQKLTAAATRGKAPVPRALMGAPGGTNQFAGREVRILRVGQ